LKTRAQSIQAWRSARQKIRTGGIVTIPKTAAFPHPRDAGAVPTATWPVGQIADYALELEFASPPLLIREFSNRFEAAVAGIAIAQQAIAIAEASPTTAMYLGGALLGAAIRDRHGGH